VVHTRAHLFPDTYQVSIGSGCILVSTALTHRLLTY